MTCLDSVTLTKTLPCLAEPDRIIIIGKPNRLLDEVLPYLATLPGIIAWNPETLTLTFRRPHGFMTLYSDKVYITQVVDTNEGLELFDALKEAVNAVWEKRAELTAVTAKKRPRATSISGNCCRAPIAGNAARRPASPVPREAEGRTSIFVSSPPRVQAESESPKIQRSSADRAPAPARESTRAAASRAASVPPRARRAGRGWRESETEEGSDWGVISWLYFTAGCMINKLLFAAKRGMYNEGAVAMRSLN